jgi:hypothetical protein
LRTAASTSLARLKAPQAPELFQTILESRNADLELRRAVAYLSGLLGPEAEPLLRRAIAREQDSRLLVNALDSLRKGRLLRRPSGHSKTSAAGSPPVL